MTAETLWIVIAIVVAILLIAVALGLVLRRRRRISLREPGEVDGGARQDAAPPKRGTYKAESGFAFSSGTDTAPPPARSRPTLQPDTAQPDTAQPDTAQPTDGRSAATTPPDAAPSDAGSTATDAAAAADARAGTTTADTSATAPADGAATDTAAAETVAPGTAAPDTAAPDTAAPDTAVPDTAATGTAAADDAAPAETAAPDTAAADTAPAGTTTAADTSATGTAATETAAADRTTADQPAAGTAATGTAATGSAATGTAATGSAAADTAATDQAATDQAATGTAAADAAPAAAAETAAAETAAADTAPTGSAPTGAGATDSAATGTAASTAATTGTAALAPTAPAPPAVGTAPSTNGAATAPPEIAPAEGRIERLRGRLARSRSGFGQGLLGLLGAGELDEESWEDVETMLLQADLGPEMTMELVDTLRTELARRAVRSSDQARQLLREVLTAALRSDLDRSVRALPHDGRPAVVLVVGVNGTGKTTTTGKLARVLVVGGRHVVLGAADTFRAAAADQLATWGERAGATVVRGPEGADPASVAFDAVKQGAEEGADAVLLDTAGRLHTKTGLMDELGKVKRVVSRQAAVDEVLLVLDATTGQNGLTQARVFGDVVDITGIALTKLDGTAKGGIVFRVQRELGVPVKLVGLGEGPDDLAPFEPGAFVDALLD